MSSLPSNFTWISDKFDSVMEAHQQLGLALKEAGPLNEKTAQLIGLAGAAACRSEGAVHSHVKRALQAGAKQEEIYHTLLLLISTVGFPTIAAAMSWAREVVEAGKSE